MKSKKTDHKGETPSKPDEKKTKIPEQAPTDEVEEIVDDADKIEENDDVVTDALSECSVALGEAKDKYLRLYSEFENYRRRMSKEKIELISSANRNLLTDLIPVLNDFDRAVKASDAPKEEKSNEGIALIHQKLMTILDKKGLKQMTIKKGDSFDGDKHEAIAQVPAEETLDNKIIEAVEPGYVLNDHIIGFAKVIVGKKHE